MEILPFAIYRDRFWKVEYMRQPTSGVVAVLSSINVANPCVLGGSAWQH